MTKKSNLTWTYLSYLWYMWYTTPPHAFFLLNYTVNSQHYTELS